MPELTFDEPTHTYRLDGIVVPSVTSILKVLGGYEGIPQHILDKAAARGSAIHKATEFYDNDTLDWTSLDDELIDYVNAWGNFREDTGAEIIEIEQRTYHPALKVAGTPDRVLVLKKRLKGLGPVGRLTLADIKSSWQMMPATGPQTAAYTEFRNAHVKAASDKVKDRLGVQLKRDGTYEVHHYNDPSDWNTFVSCLNVTRWKEKYRK